MDEVKNVSLLHQHIWERQIVAPSVDDPPGTINYFEACNICKWIPIRNDADPQWYRD